MTAWLISFDFPEWSCLYCSESVPWKVAICDVPDGRTLVAVRHPACDEAETMLIAEAPRAECRWCGQETVWCLNVAERKRVPIDPHPTSDGNVVQMLRDGRTPGVRFLTAEERVTRQGARYWSHMVKCPERERALAEIEAKAAAGRSSP